MSEQNIPGGNYDCWACVDSDSGKAAFPITADRDGWAQIRITVAIAEKGSEEAFATADVYQTIDPEAPARGSSDTTPYDFAVMALMALGAESKEAIAQAFYEGITSEEQTVTVPGVGAPGKRADAKVSYKAGTNGGTFMNVSIFAKREVAQDTRSKLAEKFKKMASGGTGTGAGKGAPPAFAPRGSQVTPPGANPFAPGAR